jgi:fatty acid desaturase
MAVNRKLLIIEFIGVLVIFALALFLGAGTIFWPAGWVFLILFFGADAALASGCSNMTPDCCRNA